MNRSYQVTSYETTQPSWIWAAVKFLFWFGFTMGLLGLMGLTAAGFFGRYDWRLDALSHFRLQYAIAALVMVTVALLGRKKKLLLGTGLVAAVNIAFFLPFLIATPTAEAGSSMTLRLVSANILYGNQTPEKVVELIRETDPDIVVLVEMTSSHRRTMAVLWDNYPYVVDNNGGNVILSRIPVESTEIDYVTFGRANVVMRLNLSGTSFTVMGVHTSTPLRKWKWEDRNGHLQEIAAFVQQEGQPTIVAGDFNISPFSPNFFALLRDSGLQNGRIGQGINTTWPDNALAILRIPIDHFLATPEISVHDLQTGPYVGSDHRPLIVDFSLNPD